VRGRAEDGVPPAARRRPRDGPPESEGGRGASSGLQSEWGDARALRPESTSRRGRRREESQPTAGPDPSPSTPSESRRSGRPNPPQSEGGSTGRSPAPSGRGALTRAGGTARPDAGTASAADRRPPPRPPTVQSRRPPRERGRRARAHGTERGRGDACGRRAFRTARTMCETRPTPSNPPSESKRGGRPHPPESEGGETGRSPSESGRGEKTTAPTKTTGAAPDRGG
jgi:hypothetical protein